MKFIIPIQSLVLLDVVTLGDVILIPGDFLNTDRKMFEFESHPLYGEVTSILRICHDEYFRYYSKLTVAILDYEYSQENFHNCVPDEEFTFLEKICYEVDRALDYLRISYCHFTTKEILPGIPGIVDTFRKGIVVDTETELSREILGRVYQIYTKPGIGLDIDFIQYDDELYKQVFFSTRKDEVYLNCRYALTRVNEALYMNNDNISFIYLMSTLEMLADSEFIQFKKVKTYILAFTSRSKNEYQTKSQQFIDISKNIRTEVVHNGKSLFDLLGSNKEICDLLNFLMFIIIDYCEQVLRTNITAFENLTIERDLRISNFS